MKTIIQIEFETTDMKQVVDLDYETGEDGEIPDEAIMTDEVEQNLHSTFINWLKNSFSKGENEFEHFQDMLIDDENAVDGFDELEDYGKITFKVTEIKK